MIRIRVILIAILAAVAATLGAGFTGYQQGLARGELNVRAKKDEQMVANLTVLIDRYAQALADSNLLSEHLLSVSAQRQAQDRTTTTALKEVLHETAALRAACVYDDRVMRQLETARDRAAQAAASGIDGAVPAAVVPDG